MAGTGDSASKRPLLLPHSIHSAAAAASDSGELAASASPRGRLAAPHTVVRLDQLVVRPGAVLTGELRTVFGSAVDESQLHLEAQIIGREHTYWGGDSSSHHRHSHHSSSSSSSASSSHHFHGEHRHVDTRFVVPIAASSHASTGDDEGGGGGGGGGEPTGDAAEVAQVAVAAAGGHPAAVRSRMAAAAGELPGAGAVRLHFSVPLPSNGLPDSTASAMGHLPYADLNGMFYAVGFFLSAGGLRSACTVDFDVLHVATGLPSAARRKPVAASKSKNHMQAHLLLTPGNDLLRGELLTLTLSARNDGRHRITGASVSVEQIELLAGEDVDAPPPAIAAAAPATESASSSHQGRHPRRHLHLRNPFAAAPPGGSGGTAASPSAAPRAAWPKTAERRHRLMEMELPQLLLPPAATHATVVTFPLPAALASWRSAAHVYQRTYRLVLRLSHSSHSQLAIKVPLDCFTDRDSFAAEP